jgi:hypothetical protein
MCENLAKNRIDHILRSKCLLKHVIEEKMKGMMQVRKTRKKKTLRKREDTGNWRRKHHIALYGEFSLEEALDLRKTNYGMKSFCL